MATTKITSPDLFNLESLNTALKLPSGTTAQRPTSPSTGEWRYNTTTNLVEFWDGGAWRDLQSEDIPPTPSENFNTVLYSGTGSAQSITGVGFKPDLVWIKERSGSAWHSWFDTTRGVGNRISSNSVNAQNFDIQRLSSFDADGFSLGTDGDVNGSGKTFVAWCWKAGGGTTSSNTEGSITSTVQANTKAGFSIVKFVGTGANATVGHGLGAAPEIIIFKSSTAISGWKMFTNQTSDPANQVMELSDPTSVIARSDAFNGTLPSSTLFSLGTYSDVNNNGNDMMAYCFKSVVQYSKIGKYIGNASQDGPLVETGFEPALLIVKKITSSANWRMVDNKRNPFNHRQRTLFPNLSNAEDNTNGDAVDFLSTGFKISNDDNSWNQNAEEFLYIAFAADPTAAPTLVDSFNTTAFTGNGTSNRQITGLNFNPSWVWIKNRTVARDHMAFDNTRLLGSENVPGVYPNLDAAEFNTTANDFNSFDADGFTVGQDPYTNENGQEMVAWSWKANSMPSINTAGTIQSIVSANANAGFSVVTWTTNGSASQTVGHGLSSTPEVIFFKKRNAAQDWFVETNAIDGTYDYLNLNLSAAAQDGGAAWSTRATSTTITAFTSSNSQNYVAYCFHEVSGFSKFGSYTGNGSATGPIVTTVFQPTWILIKRATGGSNSWAMIDSTRGSNKELYANLTDTESTFAALNFLSDGFQITNTANGYNANGDTYFYMAFKENPAQPVIPSGKMKYLVVAGGASGGRQNAGGGGGGGLRTSYGATSGGGASAESDITLAAGTYTITVGAGGAALASSGVGNNGVDSSIAASSLTTITSTGGGGGYGNSGSTSANNGGSGGGAGTTQSNTASSPGSGTANQGFDGGARFATVNTYAGGGGGGASAAGQASTGQETGGNGGAGLSVAITGSYVTYAGGGGGGGITSAGSGGAGGGTAGGLNNGSVTDATANTGGGSGGTRNNVTAGSGGSGIVILRMNTSDYSGVTSGAPTITTIGSETILKYTASGGYAHNYDIPAGSMAYLVVAGGGGSGNEGSSFTTSGAGGGAGGLRTSYGLASGGGTSNESFLTLSAGTYTITIGAGGGTAANGSASTITGNGSVSTVGGGGGGQNSTGNTGGSGGGGGSNVSGSVKYAGGSGTTGEGFGGSIGDVFFWSAIGSNFAAGGGGGGSASAAVTTNAGTTGAAGEGGDGLPVGITGSNNYYAAGGGGFKIGLAVNGLGHHSTDGQPGQNNTGDGAPKWSGLSGFSGGSGVVVLRMKTTDYSGTTTGSPTVTTDGSDTILTFTGSGTYVHS